MSDQEDRLYFSYCQGGLDCYDTYCKESTDRVTRFGQKFTWESTCEGVPTASIYASVRDVDDSTVSLHSTAAIPRPLSLNTDFWEVLHSFLNQSLWRSFRCDGDGKWIHRGLVMGTLVIVSDGSYMPKVDKHVCSAGFMIACTTSKCKAKGTVVERSDSADNYRGELLGGLMVQLVLRAASQLRSSPYRPVEIAIATIKALFSMAMLRHGL